MIKKLQMKFILIIMAIFSVVLLVIFGAINYSMFQSGEQQSLKMMQDIANMDGMTQFRKPHKEEGRPPKPEFMPQSNFSVKLDEENQIIEILSDGKLAYTDAEISELVDSALVAPTDEIAGLRVLIDEKKPYGKIIVFMDKGFDQSVTYRLLLTSLIIGVGSWILIFFVALYLSSWAIKPVKKSFEAQRQFVADAGHELKTPLAVISANADVVKSELGENKWLGYILDETARMNVLVNDLLYLAKNDSDEIELQVTSFHLSQALMSVCLPFESMAYENHKDFVLEIQENLWISADENRMKQVAVILIDNAFKHTDRGGKIVISLRGQGAKIIFSVCNTGQGIEGGEKEKIFERFYRSDSSRTRETGGYGLGLAIAKTIVERHKGKIVVESEQGKWAKFTITFA